MATWQQGNSGSFLAGIGQNNSNAPQASDANAALSLIRSNNDLARSGQNNLGVQLSGAVNSIAGAYKSGQQQLRQQQFQQAFGQAYAKGDRDALKKLAASNPDQIEAIQKGMGFIDADKNQQIGAASMDLQLAAQSGNPQAVASAIQKNAGVLQGLGLDPQTAFQAYQQDPHNFSKTADLIGMHALGPEKYFDFQDKAAGRSIQRDTLAETQRSNQAGEALTSRNQEITIRGQNIGAQNAALDREIKRSELKDKSLDRQIAREANDVRLAGLREQQAANQQAVTQKMQDYVGAHQSNVNNVTGMLDTVNQVKGTDPVNGIKPDDFDRVFGFGGKINSLIPGSPSADAWSKIEQMQGQARLMGVIGMKGTGPVSDSEGQAAARSFLAINQNMSPKAARAAIDNWQKTLQRQANYLSKQQPTVNTYQQRINEFNGATQAPTSPTQTSSPQQGGYSSLWGD